MIDDVLDYSAKQATLGKTVGDDFREGKMTLPVVLAVARGDAAEVAFWRRTIEELDQNEGDLETAIGFLEAHGSLADSAALARDYAAKACSALSRFPDVAERRALLDVVRFCVERAY